MKLQKIVKRTLFYTRQGYALAHLPFMFAGYASSIYYLAILNIPTLQLIFGTFTSFLITAAISLPLLCGVIGYIYMKRSPLFREAQTIVTEVNPYATTKITPNQIPLYQLCVVLAHKHNEHTIATNLNQLINNSQ